MRIIIICEMSPVLCKSPYGCMTCIKMVRLLNKPGNNALYTLLADAILLNEITRNHIAEHKVCEF